MVDQYIAGVTAASIDTNQIINEYLLVFKHRLRK